MQATTPYMWLPVGALLGGALGNLADRAREGAVIDFIDFVAWPAFNLADVAIVLGLLGLLYVVELGRAAPKARSGARRMSLEFTAEEDGVRLDVALGARPEVGSRTVAQRLIDAGPRAGEHRGAPQAPQARRRRLVTAHLEEASPRAARWTCRTPWCSRTST